jgi:lambda repressor-like predicted transcriptional regulator
MDSHPVKKASQEDWHPADVIAALRKKGITLRSIADKAGLASGSSTLSAALTRSLPANEKRIADALGIHPMVIWPSRYNADGTIKPRGFRALQFNARENARNGRAAAEADKQAVAA